jgi:type II secretory pathway component PulF
MPDYRFLAKEPSGNLVRATMTAADRATVLSTLRGRGLQLLKIETEQDEQADWLQSLDQLHPLHYIRPTRGQVELMLEQLTVLLRSGMSLLMALRTIAEQARFRPLRRTVEDLSRRIQTGDTLADAMSRHRCFPELIVQLVRVGEQTGELDFVCQQGARRLSRQRANQSRLITAIAYPTFVALAATGVAVFMVLYVIPKLRNFLAGLGRQLPPMTQRLMDFSTWLQTNGVYLGVALAVIISLIVIAYRTRRGRLWIDRMLLRVPVIGNVLRLAGTVSFASSMSVLTRSGVTVLDGLQTVERLQSNYHLARCVSQIRRAVLEGGDMSGTLHTQRGFSPMLAGMVRVGEDTGQLDEVLEHVAEFHDAQLEKVVKQLGAMLEPTMIILVGAMVGYVYMAFFVAIYNVGGGFR